MRGRVDENPEHTTWYSIGTLGEMVTRHGFAVESVRYGSADRFHDWLVFLPTAVRHTALFMVARHDGQASEPREGLR